MAIQNNSVLTLKGFLTSDAYHIPKYQRGYAWKTEQLEDFWTDLIQLYNDDDIDYHFIGLIVVHLDENETKKYIIDGQQRASTSTILLDSIRKALFTIATENNDEDAKALAEDITHRFIGRTSQRLYDPHLILGEIDKSFFEEYIQSTEKITPVKSRLKPSTKKILEASMYFDKKIESFINEETDVEKKVDKLVELKNLFIERFRVLYLETNDMNEAFIIFETLNARGKELDTSDLLKNHIFRQSGGKLLKVQDS